MRHTSRALILVLAAAVLANATPARAWHFVSGVNAYGDAATAIVQPASNHPDAVLAVGCDGDRWRMLAIGPRLGANLHLARDPQVRHSFTSELGPSERWLVQRLGSADRIAYTAPTATLVVRSMIQQEARNKDAVLHAEVRSNGQPLLLEFPLAGLRAAVRKELWEPCKMGNYIPESEFDAQ